MPLSDAIVNINTRAGIYATVVYGVPACWCNPTICDDAIADNACEPLSAGWGERAHTAASSAQLTSGAARDAQCWACFFISRGQEAEESSASSDKSAEQVRRRTKEGKNYTFKKFVKLPLKFCLCFSLYHAIVMRGFMGIIRISGNVLNCQHFSSQKNSTSKIVNLKSFLRTWVVL